MNLIRSILFNICFIAWTSLCCLFMVWSFAIPRPMMVKVITQYFKGLDPIEKYVIGLTYEVKGRENMLDTPCLIAIKHQSAWETFKLFQLFGDVAIVLKRELMFIPFWGWYQAKSGAIPVNRAAGGVRPCAAGVGFDCVVGCAPGTTRYRGFAPELLVHAEKVFGPLQK